MIRARVLAVSAFALLFGLADTAMADIISDEQAQCQAAAEGDACQLDGNAGVCAKSKCGRNDYSDGPPPKHVTVDCLVCAPKPAQAVAPEPSPKPTLASTETKTASDTKTPSGESKPATTSKSGCTAGGDAYPWMICVVFGLGLVRRASKPARAATGRR